MTKAVSWSTNVYSSAVDIAFGFGFGWLGWGFGLGFVLPIVLYACKLMASLGYL